MYVVYASCGVGVCVYLVSHLGWLWATLVGVGRVIVFHIASKYFKYVQALFMSNRGVQFVSMPIVHAYANLVLFMWLVWTFVET